MGQKEFKSKKFLGPKSILDPDRISLSKNIFVKEKMGPKEIWVKKLGSEYIFGPI